ncbi:MAG: hypothetical protein PHY80_04250 [Rickettsiales bacterium]|nr:hypothetical protein [Rickettsiales bacterium]
MNFRKIINNFVIIFIIFLSFISRAVYASAWVRPKHKLFSVMEFLRESSSSNNILNGNEEVAYNINSYKLYMEYGLLKKITLGGYIKNYNFNQKYFDENNLLYEEKVKNDFYANIFIIQNLYNKNKNLFSLEYSFYAPIKYNELSKKFNTFDARTSYEFLALFGKDGDFNLKNFINIRYFIDSRVNYRIFNNINYDRFTFETTLGLRLNPTSSVNFYYEYQDHIKSDNLPTNNKSLDSYTNYNSNQIRFSLNYKFLDELSTEFSYFRKFCKTNSSGLIISFIFNL